MKKKKWTYITLIVLLVLPILFFYHAFNGNPLWKWMAKSTVNEYLETTYPDEEFQSDNGFYDFKIGGYVFTVHKVGAESQKTYDLNVTGFFKPTVTYDEIYYSNLDTNLIDKWSEAAAKELTDVLQEVDGVKHIAVQLEVLKGTYESSTPWSKDVKLEKPMYIDIVIDAEKLNKKQLLATMQRIQRILNQEDYNYDYVNINANLFDDPDFKEGYVKYASSFAPDEKISLKDIEEYNQ